MTFMKREPNSKNRITKTGEFFWRTTKKLKSSKEIDENGKKKAIKKQFNKKNKIYKDWKETICG